MKVLLAIITWLIVIDACAGEQVPELEISEIAPGVYLHKSYSDVEGYGLVSSNGLVVIDGKSAFMIDTPWSIDDTKKLAAWIKDNDYELSGSISTHSHADRAAGIPWLNSESIPTFATKLTNEILIKEGKEPALNSIDDTQARLFDKTVEVFYPGGGHTIDNIVVWLPRQKILAGGCFARSLGSKSLGYTGEARIDQWSGSVDKVLSRYPEVKIVVPGHGKVGDISLLEHTKMLAESASKEG